MSNKMPYYALDKVAATISVDAKARVKWDKRAAEEGKSVTTLMAKFLEDAVRDDPFTLDDVKRAMEYMLKNEENRKRRAEKKGALK